MTKIYCNYDELLSLEKITPNELNENGHTDKQVNVLAKIIKKDGIRHPIIISKLTNKIVIGHGRLLAFKKLKLKNAPVVYQDFINLEQEMRVRNADNNISKYAEFSREQFEQNLQELKLDIGDIDLEEFGEIDFKIEEINYDLGQIDDNKREERQRKINNCPECGAEL